jgi:hypothetical protein
MKVFNFTIASHQCSSFPKASTNSQLVMPQPDIEMLPLFLSDNNSFGRQFYRTTLEGAGIVL